MKQENQNLEYKRIWNDEYLKWICGFANAKGGTIYIGLDDNGNVCGIKDSHKQMEDIPNKIVAFLGIVADVYLHQKDNMEYIEIIVNPSNVPISYKGIFYYRSGATKQELKGAALQRFILKKMGRSWDEIICDGARIEHIDNDAVAYFIHKGINAGRLPDSAALDSVETILRNLDLTDEDNNIRNAAILLFGKQPSRFFSCIEFKIGRFLDETELINQDVITGNLIQMADKVIETLDNKYLIRPIRYEGLQRIEPLEIPKNALREIIFNAIIHKEYPGYSTQMRIYNDRIWLWNFGDLPEGITFEQFMNEHSSCPRNRLIARVFYLAGFIESWGRGINKIKKEFSENGMEIPVYKEEMGGMSVYIKRDISNNDSNTLSQKMSQKKNNNVRERIYELIDDNPYITRRELIDAIGINQSAIQKHINVLIKDGFLERKGQTNGSYYIILKKYK